MKGWGLWRGEGDTSFQLRAVHLKRGDNGQAENCSLVLVRSTTRLKNSSSMVKAFYG
jgi:hypothetical protein